MRQQEFKEKQFKEEIVDLEKEVNNDKDVDLDTFDIKINKSNDWPTSVKINVGFSYLCLYKISGRYKFLFYNIFGHIILSSYSP